MSPMHWTIFPADERWRLARSSAEGPVFFDVETLTDGGQGAPDAMGADGLAEGGVVERVVQVLRQEGYADEGVVLALPSRCCMAVTIANSDESAARDPQALAFALEQQLPLAAEEFVAASIDGDAGRLGLAIAIEPVREWIDALETAGVVVQSVAPAALLAVQELGKRDERQSPRVAPRILANPDTDGVLANPTTARILANSATNVVAWQDGAYLECFVLTNGKPRAWHHLPAERAALAQYLGIGALTNVAASGSGMTSAALYVTACNLAPHLLETIARLPGVVQESIGDKPLHALAATAAARVLEGTMAPWAEFRIGALANADPFRAVARPLRFAALAIIVCLAVVAGTMFFRAHGYRALAARCHEQQAEVFRRALPGQTVPAGIVSRLESEYGKLAASKSAPIAGTSGSALVLLHRLLAGLPQDVHYRLLEIRLQDGRIELDGEVATHGHADRIAAALRGQELQVDVPRSQQLPNQTVGVRLSASLAPLVTTQPVRVR
ncbi:MAG TPA: hypothetical protein VMV69_02680 [Pirellulales bacterium]|nr:hypothetical protein [Pirellulales bacterium]